MTTLIPQFDLKNGGATPTGAINRAINLKLAETVSVADFGAVGDGTTDDTTAIQNALNSLSNNGSISFEKNKIYKTTSVLTLSPTLFGILIEGNGATISAAHNGNGLDITSSNESYSRHTINNLNITGPNVAYPANAGQLAGTSTGAALKIGPNDTTNTVGGYLVSVNNCRFQQFYQGIYLQNALLCNFNGGYVAFNQFGIYVDSGQTNANTFNAVSIRENRVFGVYSSDRTGGSLTNATNNRFYGCNIETNIPYDSSAGGYPSTFDGAQGFGVKLWNSYDWIFDGCYFENHNYSVMIENSSDDNIFQNCRFDGGGVAYIRQGGIVIAASTCNNNKFIACNMIDFSSSTNGTFQILSVNALYTQIINCSGFRFNPATFLATNTFISNQLKSQGTAGNGQYYGAIQMPRQGYIDNPGTGTTPGTITGIGTSTATLNSFGYGEVQFGNQITGNTTITTINDINSRGKILVLINYQVAYTVTIKSAANGTGTIVLTGFSDVVMNGYGQMLVLYCTSSGGFYEIGRNF